MKRFPEQITAVTERIAGIEKDISVYAEQNGKLLSVQQNLTGGTASVTALFGGMTVNGVEYTEKEPAAKALLEACKTVPDKKDMAVGSYMGFDMSIRFETFDKQFFLLLRGSMTYQTELGTDAFGNITRINNVLNDLPNRLEGAKSQLETYLSQQEAAKHELERPFTLAGELAEKEARLALLNADLNIDGGGGLDVLNDADTRHEPEDEIEPPDDDGQEIEYERQPASAKSAMPSFLDGIREYTANKQPTLPGKKPNDLVV
jgi:hypothetical protein